MINSAPLVLKPLPSISDRSFKEVFGFSCAVYKEGDIFLDILKENWRPIYDVPAVLTSIQVPFSLWGVTVLHEV